jgi:hypothetical protein
MQIMTDESHHVDDDGLARLREMLLATPLPPETARTKAISYLT